MSASKQPPKTQLLPFQSQNVASNQQAVPLKYTGGTNLIAVQWMTQAMNKVTTKVPGAGKKG